MKRADDVKRARNTDIRILPAVVGVGAILFALKASGLAFGASAAPAPQPAPTQAATSAPAPAPPASPSSAPTTPATATPAALAAAPAATAKAAATPPVTNGAPDPLAAIDAALPNPADKPTLAQTQNPAPSTETRESETAGISPAEVDVLTSLADRRDALQERQRQLDTQANVLAAAEKRVDDKIVQLKALQAQIEALLGQRDTKETQQFDSLVRIYSAMKPKDAARIFASLNDEVRIGVAGRMKPDAMAGIMAALPAEVAQKMTVELASHYKMAPNAAATAAAMTAAAGAAAPPAGQPAAAAPAPAAQATTPPKPGG